MYRNADDLPFAYSLPLDHTFPTPPLWPIHPMQPPRKRHITPLALPVLLQPCPFEPPSDR